MHRAGAGGRAIVRHRQEHVVDELRLVGAAATDMYTAAFTAGHRCSVGSVAAVWWPFHPTTRALGAVPYWKPRCSKAASSFPVLKRLPKTGRSVAAFVTHETNPEQSVPAGESPPTM